MADQAFIIAESFEPKIGLAMLEAFAAMKDSVTLNQLETVLRNQGIGGMQRLLADMQIEGIIESSITDDLNEAIMESGRATFAAIPDGLKTGQVFRYDLINPTTAQYVRNYELSLVQKISANTREAIRNNIEASVISGQNPKVTARKFRDTIGLTPNQERAVQNYEKALRDMDSSSLKRALRDKRFDSTVLRSIKNNQPLSEDQIERMVTRYRERYIKYRAETIARTESLRAVSVGDYTSALQAVNEGAVERERLKRFWVYTRGKRTRPPHRQIPSMNPLGVYIDEPFQTPLGPLMFPRDPNGTAANTIR